MLCYILQLTDSGEFFFHKNYSKRDLNDGKKGMAAEATNYVVTHEDGQTSCDRDQCEGSTSVLSAA